MVSSRVTSIPDFSLKLECIHGFESMLHEFLCYLFEFVLLGVDCLLIFVAKLFVVHVSGWDC